MNNSFSIKQNRHCSGCGICAIVCPNNCISIKKNRNGFFEPFIDEAYCTNCGFCKLVCFKYFSYQSFCKPFLPKSVYGAWSKNEYFLKSCSSGGISTELAHFFFKEGYKICGVTYDYNLHICKHIIANSINDLNNFMGSKYLQSYTVDAFSNLTPSEKYLIFGTPCQIYGIRQYVNLKKISENFILVDFYCHGIPSYNLWEKYLNFLKMSDTYPFNKINFVSKRSGWHNRSISITSDKNIEYCKRYYSDLFGIFYGGMYCHNEACFRCPFRMDSVYSDIRVADFWGDRFKTNQSGVNLLTINTMTGQKAFDLIKDALFFEKATVHDLFNSKPWRFHKRPFNYNRITSSLQSEVDLIYIFNRFIKPFLFIHKNIHRIDRLLRRMINFISRKKG